MPHVPFIDDGDLPTNGATVDEEEEEEDEGVSEDDDDEYSEAEENKRVSEVSKDDDDDVSAGEEEDERVSEDDDDEVSEGDLPIEEPEYELEYKALGCFADENNSGRIMKYKLHDIDLTTEVR